MYHLKLTLLVACYAWYKFNATCVIIREIHPGLLISGYYEVNYRPSTIICFEGYERETLLLKQVCSHEVIVGIVYLDLKVT